MASITIKCGPSHKSRRPRPSNNSLAAYVPKMKSGGSNRRTVVVKRSVPANNKFAALAVDTTHKSRRDTFKGPRPSVAAVAQGSWGKKLTISLSQAKPEQWKRASRPTTLRKVSEKADQKPKRPCAYCKEEGCHIRTCDKLAAKNLRKAQSSRKAKEQAKKQKWLAAEARIAEQVRRAQEQEQVVEVVEESSDSSDSEVDEYPALEAAIASGKVTTQRGSNWGAFRRVSFKDDSENLMKPPCDTKVFNKEDPPSAISDDDEEDVILLQKAQDIFKPSANAWRPRRRSTGMTAHERQIILDQIKEKEAELASYSTDSWADADEIEELEAEIEELNAKLA